MQVCSSLKINYSFINPFKCIPYPIFSFLIEVYCFFSLYLGLIFLIDGKWMVKSVKNKPRSVLVLPYKLLLAVSSVPPSSLP